MAWTRRRAEENSSSNPASCCPFHDDLSYDSDSAESSRKYAAYFSQQKNTPHINAATLSQRQHQLIFQFPTCAFEINALAYYYGLFTPEKHTAIDAAFNRLFCFFQPEELKLSNPEIQTFREDLRKFSG